MRFGEGYGLTIELLQHALHGAGAAAAGHGDVELVVVFGHFEGVLRLLWALKCGLVDGWVCGWYEE
jgi:hypothetical protein